MTKEEKCEIADAIRENIGDSVWTSVEDIFAAIEPIIEKIVKRSRLEGATMTTRSLIG